MWSYTLRRLLATLPTLLAVITACYLLVQRLRRSEELRQLLGGRSRAEGGGGLGNNAALGTAVAGAESPR